MNETSVEYEVIMVILDNVFNRKLKCKNKSQKE